MSHNIIIRAKIQSKDSLLKDIQELKKGNPETHHEANTRQGTRSIVTRNAALINKNTWAIALEKDMKSRAQVQSTKQRNLHHPNDHG